MTSQNTGAEIVLEAYNLITGDRQNSYSHPFDDYDRTVNIFNAVMGHDVLSVEEGVIYMVCVKLSRLMHEIRTNQWNPDNIRDAIGYLGCLQMVREHRNVISK